MLLYAPPPTKYTPGLFRQIDGPVAQVPTGSFVCCDLFPYCKPVQEWENFMLVPSVLYQYQ